MMIGDVKRLTAIYFGVTRAEIEGRSKAQLHSRPRTVAMALCRYYTSNSLPQIGRAFGGRDHTTALYAERALRRLVGQCEVFRRELALLCAQIEAGEITAFSEWADARRARLMPQPEPAEYAEDKAELTPAELDSYASALARVRANFAVRTPAPPHHPAVRNLPGPRVLLLRGPGAFSGEAA